MDPKFFLILLQALKFVVFADVIGSWFVRNPNAFPRNLTHAVAGPLCFPFKKLIPPEKLGGIDVSPIFVFVGLSLAANAIAQAAGMG